MIRFKRSRRWWLATAFLAVPTLWSIPVASAADEPPAQAEKMTVHVIEGFVKVESSKNDPNGGAFRKATVRISLEDTTVMDVASKRVALLTLFNVSSAKEGDSTIPFALGVVTRSPRAKYRIRAHVDVDGDGMISSGDYLSTGVPVLTGHDPEKIELLAKPQ